MSVDVRKKTLLGEPPPNPDWARRRDIALAIIGWFVIVAVVLWAAAHIIGALLTVIVAALFSYAIHPLVERLTRMMPRLLAIPIAYIIVLAALGVIGYLVVNAAISEVVALTHQISALLAPGPNNGPSQLTQQLTRLGVPQGQVQGLGAQLLGQAQALATAAVPVIAGIFGGVVSTILVIVLSIYLEIDGHRITRWLRTSSPLRFRARVIFLVTTFERVVGGYIRGQIALAALVGLLVGVGMFVFRVPYAVLLGLLAFILEFIPIIGVFISGAACVLLALTQSPLIAALVLGYFIFVHIIEGDVVGPRIVGRAVGLHPAVSIFALLAGAELFGLWGALFASPVAGMIQSLATEIWREWRDTHPHQFPEHFGPPQVPVTTSEAIADDPSPAVATPSAPEGSGGTS
jgi:predicted PurR-regulated permease PerM